MTLTELLQSTDLNDSLLFGYYGGGNYGDELLLEVLGNVLVRYNTKNVAIAYIQPAQYHHYHHDFGYGRINMEDRAQVVRGLLSHKNIIIGGGGLWGVDMNFNTFLLSVMLFVSRKILGKKIYLLGVGYYNSTNRLGKIAAWLAGKAANAIVARDTETQQNFSRINRNVGLDTDMAWHVRDIDLQAYQPDIAVLESRLRIDQKTIVVALRSPQSKVTGHHFTQFTQTVEHFIAANPDKSVIVAIPEAEAKSPEEHAQARAWAKRYSNVQLLDFPYNPLALYLFFQQHNQQLALIAPQFHIILTAHLTGVPFTPVVYDNKVNALFDQIGVEKQHRIAVQDVTADTLQTFANSFYGGKA